MSIVPIKAFAEKARTDAELKEKLKAGLVRSHDDDNTSQPGGEI